MPSDDAEYWEPKDEWIAGLIRHLRGWPRGEYVPPGLIKEWRAILRWEALRVALARRAGQDPYSLRSRRSGGEVFAYEVILDLLQSPEGRLVVDMVLAMPALTSAVVEGAALLAVRALRPAVRHEVAPTYSYATAKVGGMPWPSYWGSRGAYIVGPDGRGKRLTSPNNLGCRALHRAAINGATPARVREWRDKLTGAAPADLNAVWSELDAAGAAAVVAADPLPIWAAEPGEPRGILPDPPRPSFDDAATAKSGGLARLVFVAGLKDAW